MGKGYNNYMCKKPFHPGSKQNIKRAWMAEQKTENDKRKQEELKVQYEKEQDLYTNRAMISSESKDKLELNFMYEAPPGAKRERQKEDDEPEYKFEWQRKYNAPREDYAKGNSDIKDQPFGIPVRNVRCIKCHKWGHINTDRECPLFSQASTSSMPTTSMDPMELMRQMREDGFGLKEHVLGHQLNPKAANQQFLQSDESDPEAEFLKSLSVADKKKLLRKLKKLSKKQKKSKKKKSKKLHKSESGSEGEKKKRKKKRDRSSSSSSSSSDDDSKREDNGKSTKRKEHRESRSLSRDSYTNEKRKTNTSYSKHESKEFKAISYSKTDKNSSSKYAKYQKGETPRHNRTEDVKVVRRHRESRSSSSDSFSNEEAEIRKSNSSSRHDIKESKSMPYSWTDSRSSHGDTKHQNGEKLEYSHTKTKKHRESRSLSIESFDKVKIEKRKSYSSSKYENNQSKSGSYSKTDKHSSSKNYKHKKDEIQEPGCKSQFQREIKVENDELESASKESKYESKAGTRVKDFEKSSVVGQSSWKPNYSSSSSSESDDKTTKESRAAKQKDVDSNDQEIRIKIEKPDSEPSCSIDKSYHPDGFSHSYPQALIETNYLPAAAEYKGKVDDRFRDINRDERSPSVKQKYKS